MGLLYRDEITKIVIFFSLHYIRINTVSADMKTAKSQLIMPRIFNYHRQNI